MPKTEEGGGRRATPRLKITLVKSPIGFDRKQEQVVTGWACAGSNYTVELLDTPATRGMILKVRHLVSRLE